MDIDDIIEAIQANRVRITDHADEEAEADQLTLDEVYICGSIGGKGGRQNDAVRRMPRLWWRVS